jgi:hypothetical protein
MPVIARSIMMLIKSRGCHGKGIATVALIDSTVRVTMRQSDSVPIASEVAMAPSNREEATGARLLSKPTAPGDRIIGLNPCNAGRITRDSRDVQENLAMITGNIAAGRPLKMAESRQRLMLCPLLLTFGAVLARK